MEYIVRTLDAYPLHVSADYLNGDVEWTPQEEGALRLNIIEAKALQIELAQFQKIKTELAF